jgi:3-oxoacyl-[acyl-carrier protein] reductase
MTLKIDGKVALVTGAGRGIGRAISIALSRAGATVVAVARTSEQIDTTVREIIGEGGNAIAIRADIAVESDVGALFDQLQARFGRLDVLINNAGEGRFGPVEEFSAVDFDQVVAVNLRGTFLCCQRATRMMIPQRNGYIINISSVVGFKGYPNQSAYTAAKHGVMGLTKSLAVELQQHGIRVSAVLPGGVDTDMVRAARPDLDRSVLMQPEDVAQTVLYLLSLSDRAAVDQIYIRRRGSQPF